MILRQTQHGLHKIFTVAVEPCCPNNKMLFAELLYKVLPCQFRLSVHAHRPHRIELRQRSAFCPRKYIVRGNMHEFRPSFRCRQAQVSRPYRIDLIGIIDIRLAFVHIGVRSTVNDGIRFSLLYKRKHRIDICNMISRKYVRIDDLNILLLLI